MFLMVDRVVFGQWLQKERETRKWTQSELGRRSGKDRAVINKIESGGALPAVETFIALSDALKLSPITLFRKAGLIPQGSDDEINLEDWQYLLIKMTSEERDELLQIGTMKIDRRQKAEQAVRSTNFKSGKIKK
jgi:transcriptional regulator with XRE-family HTH domain